MLIISVGWLIHFEEDLWFRVCSHFGFYWAGLVGVFVLPSWQRHTLGQASNTSTEIGKAHKKRNMENQENKVMNKYTFVTTLYIETGDLNKIKKTYHGQLAAK